MIDNKEFLLKAINCLSCPSCNGDFLFDNEDEIKCKNCNFVVKIINDNIFQFENSSISKNILEKTMCGPEYEELKNEIKKYKENKNFDNKKDFLSLDYGCGSSQQVFEMTLNSSIVFGLDYDLEPLKIASNVAKEMNFFNIFFIQYSGEDIPFKKEIFDTVTSHQSLEHVKNPEKVIEKIVEKMKKNAMFYVDFPNGSSLGEFMREFFHKVVNKKNPHISHINFDRANKMFSNNNLEIIDFIPCLAIIGPIIYFIEGFIFRFIFKKYQFWDIRKKYYSNFVFVILTKLENKLMKFFPKTGHAFSFKLRKISL